MRSKWTWASTAIIVAAVAGLWFYTHRRIDVPVRRSSRPSVQLADVRYGTYAVVLTEAGEVGGPAGTASQLSFPLSGMLGSVYVHVGERVSAGQPLAALDTRALALDAEQASADARAAIAQAAAAGVDRYSTALGVDRANLARAERLYRAGVTAAKDVQAARARLAADEASASAAGANRAAAQAQAQSAVVKSRLAATQLARATLYSPVSGVVTAISRRVGEAVDPTTAVISVGPPAQAESTLRVPSADAAQIRVGDPVHIAVTGTDLTTNARVTAVVPAVNPATQSATVVVDGVPSGAVAGNAITARIVVAHVRGLLIPESSIVQDPQSGANVVFVQDPGSRRFEQRNVTVVHEDGMTAQIRGNLHRGERIAARGAFELLAPASG